MIHRICELCGLPIIGHTAYVNGAPCHNVASECIEALQDELGRLDTLLGEAWDAGAAYATGSYEDFQQTHPNKAEHVR
jgi:hypothetical protein